MCYRSVLVQIAPRSRDRSAVAILLVFTYTQRQFTKELAVLVDT